jgi:hypothetical protein
VRQGEVNPGHIFDGGHHGGEVTVFQPENIPQQVALLLAN